MTLRMPVLTLAAALAAGSIFASEPGHCVPASTTPIFEVGGVALEGLTVTGDGTIYASGSDSGRIFKRTTDGAVTEVAQLWADGSGVILGMTADHLGNVYVAVNHFLDPTLHGVWRIDKEGLVELHATIPSGTLLNGITIDDRHNLYVSDSWGGAIWVIPTVGQAELWVQDGLLMDSLGFGFGVNGLDYFRGSIYGSITLDGRVVEVPIHPDGSAGAPENYVIDGALFGTDQAVFDLHGNLYAANVFFHSILKVDESGVVTTFVSANDDIYKPASVVLGRRGDHFSIYVTNFEDAAQPFPPPNPEPDPADVTRVDLCPPGTP